MLQEHDVPGPGLESPVTRHSLTSSSYHVSSSCFSPVLIVICRTIVICGTLAAPAAVDPIPVSIPDGLFSQDSIHRTICRRPTPSASCRPSTAVATIPRPRDVVFIRSRAGPFLHYLALSTCVVPCNCAGCPVCMRGQAAAELQPWCQVPPWQWTRYQLRASSASCLHTSYMPMSPCLASLEFRPKPPDSPSPGHSPASLSPWP